MKSTSVRDEAAHALRPAHQPAGRLRTYHYLFVLLAERDLKERYAGSWMGLSWTLIQPLALFGIYLLVFSVILKLKPDSAYAGVPFYLWLLGGLTPWLFVAEVLARSPAQVVEHHRMVTKNAFPNEMLPTVTVLSALINHALTLALLLALLWRAGLQPSTALVYLPAWTLVLALFVTGMAWFLSAVGVYFKDLVHLAALLGMVWSFGTPIFYPEEKVPAAWAWLLRLNPLLPMLHGYRAALLGRPFDGADLAVGLAWALGMAAVGWAVFRRLKPGFADLL